MFKPVVIVALVGLAMAGCGAKDQATPATTSPTTVKETTATPVAGAATLTIQGMAFAPQTLAVKKGTVITVTNKDSLGHSVTARTGAFDTDVLAANESATLTMDTVGSFAYFCSVHPTMTGTITVVE